MPYEHEREHYRIMYPTAARPRFTAAETSYEVVDLSEQGMRCRVDPGGVRGVGEVLEGLVRFRRGEEVRVMGRIVRASEREIAVRLDVGVPLRIILDEQRYLRERHRGSAW